MDLILARKSTCTGRVPRQAAQLALAERSTSTTDSIDLKFNFPHIAGLAGAITWPTRLDETVTLDATCSGYCTFTVYSRPFAAELSKKSTRESALHC